MTTAAGRLGVGAACAAPMWTTAPTTTARHAIPPLPDPNAPIIGVAQFTVHDVQLDDSTFPDDVASSHQRAADYPVLRLRWPEQLHDAPTLPLLKNTIQRTSVPVAAHNAEAVQRYLDRARLLLISIEDSDGVCHAYCTLDIRRLLHVPLQGVWSLHSCLENQHSRPLGHVHLQVVCAIDSPPSAPTELAARAHNDQALAALRHARHQALPSCGVITAVQLQALQSSRAALGSQQDGQPMHGAVSVGSSSSSESAAQQTVVGTAIPVQPRIEHPTHAAAATATAANETVATPLKTITPDSHADAGTARSSLISLCQALLKDLLDFKHACAQAAATAASTQLGAGAVTRPANLSFESMVRSGVCCHPPGGGRTTTGPSAPVMLCMSPELVCIVLCPSMYSSGHMHV